MDRGSKILFGWIWPLNAFVMLKIRFGKDQLFKLSMIYLYIKPEVKKIMQHQCSYKWNLHWVITWKLLLGEEGFSSAGNEQLFYCWARFSFSTTPHLQSFPQMFRERGREVHTLRWQQARLNREHIFDKMEDTEGIIQRDNSAGHSFKGI